MSRSTLSLKQHLKPILAVIMSIFCIGMILLSPVKAQIQNPLTPSDVRTAYDVNALIQSGYTGKGVTVAIVGEGVGPTFTADVEEFSGKYGLPSPSISVVKPFGSGGDSSTWDEVTGDTEMVHAMAPDAKILLVLVGAQDVPEGFSYVIDHNAADVATMSFYWYWYGSGSSGTVWSYNEEYAEAVSESITLISGSGDFGSNNTVPRHALGTPISGAFWTQYLPNAYLDIPEYSPYVTIVGGTALTVQSGAYSEVGWTQSGGGPSRLFPEPSWQTGLGVPENGFRNIPDIALDASCSTPYAIDWNNDQETWMCGTSMSAPTFAGIIADIDQAAGERVGFLNPTLYTLAASDPSVYHPITSGCSLVEVGTSTTNGYCAHAGWNFVTGWGSIDAAKLAMHLAPSAHILIPEFPIDASVTVATTIAIVALLSRKRRIRTEQ